MTATLLRSIQRTGNTRLGALGFVNNCFANRWHSVLSIVRKLRFPVYLPCLFVLLAAIFFSHKRLFAFPSLEYRKHRYL